jgi:hypothetical protein
MDPTQCQVAQIWPRLEHERTDQMLSNQDWLISKGRQLKQWVPALRYAITGCHIDAVMLAGCCGHL